MTTLRSVPAPANDTLGATYARAANPAMSLLFVVPEQERANTLFHMLLQTGALPASATDVDEATAYPELHALVSLLDAYGVTVIRGLETGADSFTDFIDGIAESTQMRREQAFAFLTNTAAGEVFSEAATQFYATTPQQTDLLRLHHDMTNLAERFGDGWLEVKSFHDNARLLPHTLDQALAYAQAPHFEISTSDASFMIGLGPEKENFRGLSLAGSIYQFCKPV